MALVCYVSKEIYVLVTQLQEKKMSLNHMSRFVCQPEI